MARPSFDVRFFVTIISCFIVLQTFAQSDIQLLPINFIKGNDTLVSPFSGGVNDGIYANADLNNDNIQDLIVFENTSKKILTFIRTNTGFKYNSKYEKNFPQKKGWIRIIDFNCDGVSDIFTNDGEIGVQAYTGSYNIDNELIFLLYRNDIQYGMSESLFVDASDTPAFIDIDNDNDIDILNFGMTGEYMYYYQNKSQEMGYGCDSLVYNLADECWGEFRKSTSITLNDPCVMLQGMEKDPIHLVPAFTALNLDGDEDVDLLMLDDAGNGLLSLINGGTVNDAFVTSINIDFPTNTTPTNILRQPLASYVDLDDDGIRDLIVTKFDGQINTTQKSTSLHYQNTGIDISPVFEYVQNDFLENEMIDVGMLSAPVYWDWNGDGLLDIILPNSGDADPTGTPVFSTLKLYENIGADTMPIYELINENFAQMDTFQFINIRPTFGDIDGDGDDDMLCGTEGNKLYVFKNELGVFELNNDLFQGIGFNLHPQFVDVNRDNLLDIILGEQNGNLNYFENTGTNTAPEWTLQSVFWGGVDVRFPGEAQGYSAPHLVPFGDMGEYHLFIGCQNGTIYHYGDVEDDLGGNFTLIDTFFMAIDEGIRSTVAVADINADNYPDFLFGNYRGGITIYSENNPNTIVSTSNPETTSFDLQIYPNPTNNNIHIEIKNYDKTLNIRMYDVHGREVISSETFQQNINLPVRHLSAGIYFVIIQNEEIQLIKKIIVN